MITETKTAFCFDLDGTVSKEELLPRIAEEADLVDEISALTQATIQGLIPFENSFRLRCRLLADVPIAAVHRAVADITFHEEVLEFISNHSDQCFVVSGNLDVWIRPLLERIPCRFYTSEAEELNGRLGRVTKVLIKSDAVRDIRKEFSNVVAVGDGMNDVPMFEAADVRIAHGAAHTPTEALRHLSDYWTVSGGGLWRLLNALS